MGCNLLVKGSKVHIPGSEWPGTEWDYPDAWYIGEVQKNDRHSMYVQFDDCEDLLKFSKSSIEEYQRMYTEFKFDMLLRAADFLNGEQQR